MTSQVQHHLEKRLRKKWQGSGGRLKYVLVDLWDHNAENEITINMKFHLKPNDIFTIEQVTYQVEEVDFFEDIAEGKAVIRMIRYRIPDTATTTVHRCLAKKEHFDTMSSTDLIRLEERYGAKKVKAWSGKVKLKTYNKLESKCEFCGVTFWKKYNSVPDTVAVDVMMDKVKKEKYDGGLAKEDLDKQVEDGTWLQIGDENGDA